MITIIFIILILLIIRKNRFLRTYLYSYLYSYGIQIGDHIYTPVCDVYSNYNYYDIVILGKNKGYLHGYYILHNKYFKIELTYIPVGHNLVHQIDNTNKEYMYMEGTPFTVRNGTLILYKKKRRGFGTYSEEISRTNKWPVYG